MAREVGHKGLTKLYIARSMRERKALMADLSDAFVAMPGGFGTLEEFCESGDMDAAWSACEALRNSECVGVLYSVAEDVRPCGRGAIPGAEEPGVGASTGIAR